MVLCKSHLFSNSLNSESNSAHTGLYSSVQNIGHVEVGDKVLRVFEEQGPELTNSQARID